MADKSILSVVETLSNQSLEKYQKLIYNADFWRPLIPLKTPVFQKTSEFTFEFEIDDDIKLEPTGNLTRHFHAKGKINVEDCGVQDHRGSLWIVRIYLINPEVQVVARVRAKDLTDKKALKIGIFILSIDYNTSIKENIAFDAVLFAIRLYLRELIQKASSLL
ncbi:MAG: hypothetical protein K9W44_07280 [Candidatus Lokiarchaeota archaeon]|nr:hypothetical protein [Candidatus Harpocratesius repetitus]